MQSFSYYSPTRVVFGKETEAQVGSLIKGEGGSRVLVLYGGGSAVKSGLVGRVTDSLDAAGLAHETLGGVRPNPRLAFARGALERARAFGADFLLAVGGGSVIDTAKAVALGLGNPGVDIWKFWTREAAPAGCAPVGVVLTIPAAGSETSSSSVLTDEETGEKRGLGSDLVRPRFAVMNPELTVTLPVYQVACGVVDIMMHTLDRYFCPILGNELTDQIAESVLRVTVEKGRAAVRDPHDYDAMSELMWAGSLSHNDLTGLGGVKDFAPHQLGHELSAMFDVAHGASLSAVWGSWADYCWETNPARFARYAKNVWGIGGTEEEAARAGIGATVDYFRSLGMPTSLGELGIGVQEDAVLQKLAVNCMYGGTRRVGTFRVLDAPDAYEIYRRANH
ncbi:iron-containing alcohol dehydrogenase [uncultured Anaerotruncus sp.]|uniref:iron-containing alcohol dehydrogenase n=1 Tax=uncultured Anaerotruncus sp. TaxID=905011 RepID=UPI00280C0E6E|nr:iron-containing alcohol dehydrogenase [uncultured Anaerotruncus sp.]